jgi:DNA transformation protein
MTVSVADAAFATDLFFDFGQMTSRKMFGGMCLANAVSHWPC